MEHRTSGVQTEKVLGVRTERIPLYINCYETLGYRLKNQATIEGNDDFEKLCFEQTSPECQNKQLETDCETLLKEIDEIDTRVHFFYLQRVVLVGMIGTGCIALSIFLLLHHLQVLFTIFLLLGLFGCTITLGLKPFFLNLGREKLGSRLPELLQELNALLERTKRDNVARDKAKKNEMAADKTKNDEMAMNKAKNSEMATDMEKGGEEA